MVRRQSTALPVVRVRHVDDPQGPADIARAFELILMAATRASSSQQSPATLDERGGAGRRFPSDDSRYPPGSQQGA
jgi:membrane protein YdbS with pleckstrin-like domain